MKKILAALGAWGLPGVFLLTIADGAGVPNPSGPDVMLLLYTSQRPDRWLVAGLVAVAGSLVGSLILYEVARKGGEKYLEGKLHSGRGRKFRDWFRHYGLVTVFIPALVPIPMPLKAFEICAGALGVRRAAFVAVFVGARLPRYLALCWLGRNLHQEPLKFLKGHLLDFVWIALGTLVLCVALVKLADRYRKPPELAPPTHLPA
ncbi:MAG: VTT domain-containing protein [Bryobacteraceae bacterium]|jgi:membrane protein YqaA with SNARE-associated domain